MWELAGILEGYCEYLTVNYAVIYNPDIVLAKNQSKALQSILKQVGPSVKATTGYTESIQAEGEPVPGNSERTLMNIIDVAV